MCGIFGVIGSDETKKTLLKGLSRMEYRGYDSSGICLAKENELIRKRAAGPLDNLRPLVEEIKMKSNCGIAHTRWATHGPPTEENAHPHFDFKSSVAVVHNGIIENEVSLRLSLEKSGVSEFESETDTELIAHIFGNELLGKKSLDDKTLLKSWRKTLDKLEGSFAVAAVVQGRPDAILIARSFAPLIVAHNEEKGYLASDMSCIVGLSKKIRFVEDGDWGILTSEEIRLWDSEGESVVREISELEWTDDDAEKGGYPTFMLKEIHEQPRVFRDCLRGRLNSDALRGIKIPYKPDLVRVIGCGTAYNAGILSRYYIEELSGIPVVVDHAHEFRYGTPTGPKALVVGISQSGETADTLAGIQTAKERGYPTLGIVNVETSTMAREVDYILGIKAGPEIGVASTKAFTGQILGGLLVALKLGRLTNKVHTEDLALLNHHTRRLPTAMERMLSSPDLKVAIKRARKLFEEKSSAFFLGRNFSYPIALEAALKLKEISYIHAEGYAGGELKHGPLALIEDGTPVVVIASDGISQQKLYGNAREVSARGAKLIVIAVEGDVLAESHGDVVIWVPKTHRLLQPILLNVVCQILALKIAEDRDCNVDRPRNLAKSVTVE